MRCEGRWRDLYITARYGAAVVRHRGILSIVAQRAVYGSRSGVR